MVDRVERKREGKGRGGEESRPTFRGSAAKGSGKLESRHDEPCGKHGGREAVVADIITGLIPYVEKYICVQVGKAVLLWSGVVPREWRRDGAE